MNTRVQYDVLPLCIRANVQYSTALALQGALAVAAVGVRPDGVAVAEGGAPEVPAGGGRDSVGGREQTRPVRALPSGAHQPELQDAPAALAARRLRHLRVPLLFQVRACVTVRSVV